MAISFYTLDFGRAQKQYTDSINHYADLAMLFRALIHRDGDGVQEALSQLDFGALDGLVETLGTEIDERLEAGEERFAEILDEVLEFAVDALERAIDDEIEWDEEAPSA